MKKKTRKKRKIKIKWVVIGCVVVLAVVVAAFFWHAEKKAQSRFANYEKKAKTVETSYGKITYIDEGKGTPILSCHGICGGYDQAYDTLADKVDEYRVIAPSRFGYPGSDVPKDTSIAAQANAFVELLDKLHIEKTYVLATSAGGATAIRFALDHPDRTQGLILYCSGYPALQKPKKTLTYEGPPAMICADFPMWFFSPLFGPLMGMNSDTIQVIMPLAERKEGIVLDASISNTDMENHWQSYDMSKLKVPVLIFHAKDDKLADYKRAEAWAKKIPDCESHIFKSGGHLMEGNATEINIGFSRFVKPIH